LVTITHPHHPLRGQQVEIVRLRRGTAPQFIVRLPDGRHATIALNDTDYLASPEDERPLRPDHLLDLHGLRQVLQVLDRIARERRPTTHDHPATAATDDPR
jgi:hypothetical protein